jgi:hypothetical protein
VTAHALDVGGGKHGCAGDAQCGESDDVVELIGAFEAAGVAELAYAVSASHLVFDALGMRERGLPQ